MYMNVYECICTYVHECIYIYGVCMCVYIYTIYMNINCVYNYDCIYLRMNINVYECL